MSQRPTPSASKYRWFVVGVFFLFMLLHQTDKLLIGPLTPVIQKEFNLTLTQVGAFSTGALIVGAIFYPLWGYLYDKYARSKLLALASFIWGATTWLNALAPNYLSFVITRSSTGIDDSSYPGLYSLIADYFGPKIRGQVIGILQLTQPLGYLLGMVLAILLGGSLGWRNIYFITGSLGIVLAVLIYFGVKEMPRGRSEPELQSLAEIGVYRFEWKYVKDLFKKRSLIMIFLQGFFGVFPWNVITYFFFLYLVNERKYSDQSNLVIMGTAVLVLAAGYPIGGMLGDWLYKRTLSGRIIVSTFGVFAGAIAMWFTLQTPLENQTQFMILLAITALFIPFASPNVVSTMVEITLPEIRSTAQAVESFIESGGAALAPLMTGIIAEATSIKNAMLLICITAWALCGFFFIITAFFVPKDIRDLRQQLTERAEFERARQAENRTVTINE